MNTSLQIIGFFICFGLILACEGQETTPIKTSESNPAALPFTDSLNKTWILNKDVSDEFESKSLDETKWLIQGTNGEFRSNFIGRAPSQFSTKNVRIENGKLKLQSKWEPEFAFSPKLDNNTKYENITTAAVITKKQFLYGYMEIKCKAANASVTSAFWATGNSSELDVFEHLGKPKQTQKVHLETEMWSSVHDWSQAGGPSVWTNRTQLPFRVASAFHVYGCHWDKDFLKFYADGKLIHEVSRSEMGSKWVTDKPLWAWVDSETFPWHGVPEKADLPSDFEIEYISIWQKP